MLHCTLTNCNLSKNKTHTQRERKKPTMYFISVCEAGSRRLKGLAELVPSEDCAGRKDLF